jgi:hypothetical protein
MKLFVVLVIIILTGCPIVGYADNGKEVKTVIPDIVILDKTEPAYRVLVSIPKEQREKITSQLKNQENIEIVEWKAFQDKPDQILTPRMVNNEYPQFQVAKGIVELLKQFPGTPVGLTWNGGIAFTYNDYQYAKKLYQQYQANPDEYKRTVKRDPKADPLNPGNHFEALLGQSFLHVENQDDQSQKK